jgi:glycoside/pentoside/hexuronide:cation symporter, GPH family
MMTPGRLLAYSLPILGIEFIIYPILAILPSFYVSLSGGELAAFATAILVSRIVYSCSGPIVGYLSDRIGTPWGRRKPWIVAGTVLEVVSVVLVFMPPRGAGPTYFAWTSALALFGFSMIDVPYIAWGSEMTRDYQVRSRITAYRAALAVGAQLLFLSLPFVPGFGGRNLLDPVVIQRLGIAAIVILTATILAALFFGPPAADSAEEKPARTPLHLLLLNLVRNRPMWFLSGAIVFSFLGYTIPVTLALQFLASVGLTTSFSVVTIVAMVLSIVSIPLWLKLTYRLGKHRFFAFALALTFSAFPLFFLVAHFFGTLAGFCAMTIVQALPSAQMLASIPYSMMGDVIDYDELKTATNHSANYSAIVLLTIRLQAAIGGSLAFFILSAFHFNVHAVNRTVVQPAMLIANFAVPAICVLIAIVFAMAYPIDARRQSIIRRRLERRRRFLAGEMLLDEIGAG